MKLSATRTTFFVGSRDSSELMGQVRYRPKVSIEEGMASFVEWDRTYYGAQA